MPIQWYPGHMYKAGKDLKNILPQIDVVIEVLDARIPFSSQNPFLAKLRGDKPCIKVLNKHDLADPEQTLAWQGYLEQEQAIKAWPVSSLQPEKIRKLPALCHQLVPQLAPGRHLQVLIMGIPNVGKSTLINILANRVVAKAANEPAVTKRQQRVDIGNRVILLDTPGMLWPNIENQPSAYRLAITGAIKDTAIDHGDITLFAAEFLLQHYPSRLLQRFRMERVPENGSNVLVEIGKRRGCLSAGGRLDMDKVAKVLLTELRSGQLGAITLETPDIIEQELVALALLQEQKAAQRLLRQKGSSQNNG